MSKNSLLTFGRTVRTFMGFLVVAAGLAGGVWLGWWLSTRGDVVEIIHDAKMSLPGWAWLALKYGLSLAVGVVFILCFLVLGVLILGAGGRE